MRPTIEERFWAKVPSRQPGECWPWSAGKCKDGYGTFSVARRSVLAHRWVYTHMVGPIPDGLVIDHLCRTRHCVNPAHLEPVTNAENIRRGDVGGGSWSTRTWINPMTLRTHCPQGHPYDEANTKRFVRPDGSKGRNCRTCDNERARARYHRNRATA